MGNDGQATCLAFFSNLGTTIRPLLRMMELVTNTQTIKSKAFVKISAYLLALTCIMEIRDYDLWMWYAEVHFAHRDKNMKNILVWYNSIITFFPTRDRLAPSVQSVFVPVLVTTVSNSYTWSMDEASQIQGPGILLDCRTGGKVVSSKDQVRNSSSV